MCTYKVSKPSAWGIGGFMKKEIEELGIDYDDLLMRLGNSEPIALKFLKRFIDDQTFTKIQKDFNDHDYDALLKDVHSLKGISANLSMNELFRITDIWVKDLRAKNFQTCEQLYQECNQEYHHILNGLKALF